RTGEKGRGMGLGGLSFVVRILVQFFGRREIPHQFSDQLLLFPGGKPVIREQFHSLSGPDVAQVTADRVSSSALEIGAFYNQSCHSSPSSQAPRTRCSSETRPLVFFTFCTLSARRRRRSSPLN